MKAGLSAKSSMSVSCSFSHEKASTQYPSLPCTNPNAPLGRSPNTASFSVTGVAASKARYAFGNMTKNAIKKIPKI